MKPYNRRLFETDMERAERINRRWKIAAAILLVIFVMLLWETR